MNLIEFRKSIMEDVRLTSATDMISEKEAFVNTLANVLLAAEELNDFVFLPFEGQGPKRKKIQIDGYSYDELDNHISIIICPGISYPSDETFTNSNAVSIFSRAKAFIEEAKYIIEKAEESSPGYGFAYDVLNIYKNVNKFKFYIFTDMLMSKNIQEIQADELFGKPAEYHIWDIGRWHQLHESRSGKEEIIIDLKKFSSHGIPCLLASKTEDYAAYLCNIPGKILGDLYNNYGGRLLEGNVRSFLTFKRKVNQEIRNTIINEPAMFFVYNNGIAATAYDVKTELVEGKLFLTEISALQIVNGGQTTASLALALVFDKDRANDLKNIYVPMKLSVVSPEKALELIPNISKYANSQNKVNESDFFSNHPFLIRIEDCSRRVNAPAIDGRQYGTKWYFERATGQYNQAQARLTQKQKEKFLVQNPKSQMFTKTDLAKYLNIYRELPHVVRTGAQKNFNKFADWAIEIWKKDNTKIDDEFFMLTVSLAIIFKRTDILVKMQPWYESGYKADIVTYTISKLLHTVRSEYPNKSMPYKSIWLKQKISKSTEDQIVLILKEIYLLLTDSKRPIQNVTEWAKREACWESIISKKIELLPSFVNELAEKKRNEGEKTNQRNEKKLEKKLTPMLEVADYGVENWKSLIKWGKENKVFNQLDMEFLNLVSEIDMGKFPTEKQCSKMMQILDKARNEGFPY